MDDLIKNMARINGGTFVMGSPADEPERFDDEGPQHQAAAGGFYMGKFLVTQEEYQTVMETNPSRFNGDKRCFYFNPNDSLPVENVSWYNAVEYCNKLSLMAGLAPAYTVNGADVTWNREAGGFRLPSEAEWEYACRAGTTTAYNTGARISDDTGWYKSNSGNKTHPVGQKPANAWGLYDMHGNVWEWCWDWCSPYANAALSDDQDDSWGTGRILRGGSWSAYAQYLRSAYRRWNPPTYRSGSFGFRLVMNSIPNS